jgi:3-oxoacyl-[acyl-carrier-protein] synthase II
MIGNRVVVTGLSAITPIGLDVESSWEALLDRKSGVVNVTRMPDIDQYDSQIAGEIQDFNPAEYIPAKQARRMDRFTQYAVAAGAMLLEHADYSVDESNRDEIGTIIGVGLGGLETIEATHRKMLEKGPNRVTPFFIPTLIANMAAGQVSIHTGARGPNVCTTSACASGMHAVGHAFTEIRLGRAQAMITGGAESTISPLGFAGFTSMKALSTRNDDPQRASRPFDVDRDGFIMSEGCGLLLLESLESAKARGATIYAEVIGMGASSDAFHIAAPLEDGAGMALAMNHALRDAGIPPTAVDHINAHGTSTKLNDICETRAIKTVFGDHAYKLDIAANKSQIGHTLGAAGGVECVFTVKTLHHGVIPATINLDKPDPECDLDYCPDGPRHRQAEIAISNSFGFGGTNACVLFKRYVE